MEEGSNRVIRQHNVITEARYDMTSLERNLVYLLMDQVSEKDPPEKVYEIPFAAVSGKIGCKSEKAIESALDRLLQRGYTIKRENGDILCVTIVSVASLDPEKGVIFLKTSHKLLPFLIALKENFTEFELDSALALRGKYSKRIYEMLCMYKRMDKKSFRVPLNELKLRLQLLNEESKEEKLQTWSSFERAVLKKAVEEISVKTDLNFSYKPHRIPGSGKKIQEIEFFFSQNPAQLDIFKENKKDF